MSRTINSVKAGSIGTHEVPELTLNFKTDITHSITSFDAEQLENFIDKEAKTIAEALIESMPQGIRYRLMMYLFKLEAESVLLTNGQQ